MTHYPLHRSQIGPSECFTVNIPICECMCTVKECSSVQSERKKLNSFSSYLLLSSPLLSSGSLSKHHLTEQTKRKRRTDGGEEKKKTGDDGTIDLLHVEQFGARALDKQSLVKSSQSCA